LAVVTSLVAAANRPFFFLSCFGGGDAVMSHAEVVAFLAAVPRFRTLQDEVREAMAIASEVVDFEPGATIVERGDVTRSVFIIVTGEAEVLRGNVRLNLLGPSAVFGEVSAMDGSPATASVVTQTRICCLALASKDFCELVRRYASLGWVVSLAAAKRLRFATEREEARTQELAAALGELRQTQTRLVQSEKMASLGLLVAGISHELNTPIGGIRGSNQTLTAGLAKLRKVVIGLSDDPRSKSVLDVLERCGESIQQGTARVEEVLAHMRRFARLDEATVQQADLNVCISESARLARPHLAGCDVNLQLEKLPKLLCDPRQLNHVFFNILLNAAQACAQPSVIEVRSWQEGDAVHVAVRDTGSGIPPASMPRIFDPGFTTRGVGMGTGLGLAIAMQVVSDHGGRIDVDTEVGAGTTVEIVLPLHPGA
jgi:signal transduction histidine kinase